MNNLDVQLKNVYLTRRDFVIQTAIARDVLRHAQFDSFLAPHMDALILRLATSVAGETVPEVNETFPATWWDAVKDRWVPQWARRWVRIDYRHIKVDKHTLFPSIEIPGYSSVVAITVADNVWSEPSGDDS